MNCQVKGRHVKLTEAMHEAVESKLVDPVLELVGLGAGTMEVELAAARHASDDANKRCRVTLTVPGQKVINLVQEDKDLYRAIALVSHRLQHHLRRNMARHSDHKGDPDINSDLEADAENDGDLDNADFN